jgi:hypothetical protein
MSKSEKASPFDDLDPAERAARLSRMTREEKMAIRQHMTSVECFCLDCQIVGLGLISLGIILLAVWLLLNLILH